MHPARLRPYRAADLPVLYALDQVCFQPGIAYSRAELRSFVEHPSSFTAVACVAELIVGFAVVRPMRRALAGSQDFGPVPVLHLLTIDVDPRSRRHGVGALLMDWVLEQAKKLASHAVVLEVAVDNEPARQFYQRFEFIHSRTLPGYYNGETDALELERAMPALEGVAIRAGT